MNWAKIIEDAVWYIEGNITDDLTVGRIATEVNISAFYFQRGFSMLCGYTVGEYVRMRRLAIAGEELLSSNIKVIDLAMKYGYDSPDSFTVRWSTESKKNRHFGSWGYPEISLMKMQM